MNTGTTTRRRFTEIDFLMISIWVASWMLEIALKPPAFMSWAVAGGALMIARYLYFTAYRGQAPEGDLIIAAATPILVLFTGFTGFVVRHTPITIDAQLAKLDLGVEPLVRTWAEHHPPAFFLLLTVYNSLPFFVLACVCSLRGNRRLRLGCAVLLGGLLATPWYLTFPAVGPVHVGDPFAARNCMPSMHLTWALLGWIHVKGRFKYMAGAFVLLTAASTLSTGEHYLPDLLVAVPWAMLLTAASKWIIAGLSKFAVQSARGGGAR